MIAHRLRQGGLIRGILEFEDMGCGTFKEVNELAWNRDDWSGIGSKQSKDFSKQGENSSLLEVRGLKEFTNELIRFILMVFGVNGLQITYK